MKFGAKVTSKAYFDFPANIFLLFVFLNCNRCSLLMKRLCEVDEINNWKKEFFRNIFDFFFRNRFFSYLFTLLWHIQYFQIFVSLLVRKIWLLSKEFVLKRNQFHSNSVKCKQMHFDDFWHFAVSEKSKEKNAFEMRSEWRNGAIIAWVR